MGQPKKKLGRYVTALPERWCPQCGGQEPPLYSVFDRPCEMALYFDPAYREQ